METKRLSYFDTAKGIGILGVIMLHSGAISDGMTIWLGAFIMPFFFIISGMLLCYKKETEEKMSAILSKKWRSVMLPYFGYSILYLLIDFFRIFMGKSAPADLSADLLYSLTFYGKSVLWFLPVLFLSEICFLFLCKKTSPVITISAGLLSVAAAAYFRTVLMELQPASLSEASLFPSILICCASVLIRTLYVIPLFCIAYYLFYYFRNFWEQETSVSVPQLICGLLLILLPIPLSQFNGPMDIPTLHFCFIPFSYLTAVATSLGFLFLCKNSSPFRLFTYFGNNSLTIMATHVDLYILYFAIKLTEWLHPVFPGPQSLFRFLLIVFFSFLLEIPCILIINRFAPFLAGKRTRTS